MVLCKRRKDVKRKENARQTRKRIWTGLILKGQKFLTLIIDKHERSAASLIMKDLLKVEINFFLSTSSVASSNLFSIENDRYSDDIVKSYGQSYKELLKKQQAYHKSRLGSFIRKIQLFWAFYKIRWIYKYNNFCSLYMVFSLLMCGLFGGFFLTSSEAERERMTSLTSSKQQTHLVINDHSTNTNIEEKNQQHLTTNWRNFQDKIVQNRDSLPKYDVLGENVLKIETLLSEASMKQQNPELVNKTLEQEWLHLIALQSRSMHYRSKLFSALTLCRRIDNQRDLIESCCDGSKMFTWID